MTTRRIHITGASGSGTTTLGRFLAHALAVPHHDADDVYWRPTAILYSAVRLREDRLRLMREMFLERPAWVLSGSLDSWGAPIVACFDIVAFLQVPDDVRLARLRAREERRFGADAIAPGGWRHRETEDFLEWASHYEDGSREGRTLARHEAWLQTLQCPVLRLDGQRPTAELVAEVVASLPPVDAPDPC